MSFRVFFGEMTQLARQQIAELFLILIIFLMIEKNRSLKSSMLLLIFSYSLVVSHYGTSYIFMLFLPLAYGLTSILQKRLQDGENFLNPTFILFFTTLALTWYIYISSGSSFHSIVTLSNHIIQSISQLFQPLRNSPLYWATVEIPISYKIERILHLSTLFFSIIGLLYVVIGRFKSLNSIKIRSGYLAFSLAFLLGCLLSIILPTFTGAGSIGFTRFYHLSLLFLSPFCIIGFFVIPEILKKTLKTDLSIQNKTLFKFVAVFFMIFLLFNSNFVAEIIHDYSLDISISKKRVLESNDALNKAKMFSCYVHELDVYSAKWLSKSRNKNFKVYSGDYCRYTVLTSYGMMRNPLSWILTNTTREEKYSYATPFTKIGENSYTYLRWMNYRLNIMTTGYRWWNTSEIIPFLMEKANKVYSNGGSVIFLKYRVKCSLCQKREI